ncbi:MAG: hypothetical protein PXZ08_08970 [Actinomycetota bacterium]|nr:hypothetical protein [Actinomycetota bacterium]
MLLIQIAGGVVLVFLVVAFLLRGRVANHSDTTSKKPRSREIARPSPSPPPSPYRPSRGFRILDGSEALDSPPVQLPRLDPDKEFVFNDAQVNPVEAISPPHLRHDERWALERSMRHGAHPRFRRRRQVVVVAVIVLVVAVVVAIAVLRHSPTVPLHSGLALVRAAASR